VEDDDWEAMIQSIVDLSALLLSGQLVSLSLKTDEDRMNVLRVLLLNNDCDTDKVGTRLDEMLSSGFSRRTTDLSPQEKQQIYENARRPFFALKQDYDKLQKQKEQLMKDQSSFERQCDIRP
jgi:hypothetical protein